MQDGGAVEIERVATLLARQSPEQEAVEGAKAERVGPQAEAAKETGERRLAGDGLNAEDLRQRRIAAELPDPRKLVGPGQHPGQEAERNVHRRIRIGARGSVRQRLGQRLAKADLGQKRAQQSQAAMRGEPLRREAHLDRLWSGRRLYY